MRRPEKALGYLRIPRLNTESSSILHDMPLSPRTLRRVRMAGVDSHAKDDAISTVVYEQGHLPYIEV